MLSFLMIVLYITFLRCYLCSMKKTSVTVSEIEFSNVYNMIYTFTEDDQSGITVTMRAICIPCQIIPNFKIFCSFKIVERQILI